MKTFILDTNVLLHDSECIFAFEDNDIIIPLVVLEELDTFKSAQGEIGHNTRQVIRHLDKLRSDGSLSDGVILPGGGKLFVSAKIDDLLELNVKVDNHILLLAQELSKNNDKVFVVTKDINLRVKADSLHIKVQDYINGRVNLSEDYKGWKECLVPHENIQQIYTKEDTFVYESLSSTTLNEFIVFKETNGKNLGVIGMHLGNGLIKKIKSSQNAVNIKPKNTEQSFALNGLLNDDITILTMQAKAGCGKTLLCIAAALQKVIKEQKYEKIIITRPVIPVGRDIGFLPGDISEKMDPWMKPIFDNINVIKSICEQTKNYNNYLDNIDDLIEVAPLAYIRGRTLQNSFIIIDESQNLTRSEVKTLITRVGEGSKVVLTGDVSQIDCIYLDKFSNGLSYIVSKFQHQPMYAHIEMIKSERSVLAEIAANIL